MLSTNQRPALWARETIEATKKASKQRPNLGRASGKGCAEARIHSGLVTCRFHKPSDSTTAASVGLSQKEDLQLWYTAFRLHSFSRTTSQGAWQMRPPQLGFDTVVPPTGSISFRRWHAEGGAGPPFNRLIARSCAGERRRTVISSGEQRSQNSEA